MVSVLLGNGDGSFQAAHSYVAGNTAYSIAVGDFNGDAIADIAIYHARRGDFVTTKKIFSKIVGPLVQTTD